MTPQKASTARRRHAAPGPTRYTDPTRPTFRKRLTAALKRFLGIESPTRASAQLMAVGCPITTACDAIERASEARRDAMRQGLTAVTRQPLEPGEVRITRLDADGNAVSLPVTVRATVLGYGFGASRGPQC